MPLHLQKQNTCILLSVITQSNQEKVIISGFKPSAKNSEIMSKSNDLSSQFPEFSYYINNIEVLTSTSIAIQLADLGNNIIVETLSTTMKKGSSNPEIRDVNNPKYVYQ